MLPTALLVLTLSASDPTAVLVTSKRAGAESYASKIAARVRNSIPGAMEDAAANSILKKSGLDPRSCQGATECHAKVAKTLGEHAVIVAVDVGKIAKTLAVHLEAVAAGDSQPFGVSDFSVPVDKWADQASEPILTFAKLVQAHAANAEDRSAASPDIPDKAASRSATADNTSSSSSSSSSAATVPPPVFERRVQPEPSPHLAPWLVGAGAVISFGGSAALLVLGLGQKSTDQSSISPSGLSSFPQSVYDAHASTGNLEFTLSLTTVILGAALGVLMGVLFATG